MYVSKNTKIHKSGSFPVAYFHFGGINLTQIIYLPGWELVTLEFQCTAILGVYIPLYHLGALDSCPRLFWPSQSLRGQKVLFGDGVSTKVLAGTTDLVSVSSVGGSQQWLLIHAAHTHTHTHTHYLYTKTFPSVLWRRWLDHTKNIHPVAACSVSSKDSPFIDPVYYLDELGKSRFQTS